MTKARANRRWLIIPPVIVGILIVVYFRSTVRSPARRPPSETARVLRVIEAPQVDVIPRVLGYGTARPAQVWRAVAEVRGHVTEVSPELKQGSFLAVDEVVQRHTATAQTRKPHEPHGDEEASPLLWHRVLQKIADVEL